MMKSEGVTNFPHGPGNERNSEGSFVTLRDGRILYAYTRYGAVGGGDHDVADIACTYSSDQGATWSAPQTLIANDGKWNIMSVSLLRLHDGRIALFNLQKNEADDCRPLFRVSADEGATWSAAQPLLARLGYFVMNNDRVIQLKGGRIVAPMAQHYPSRSLAEPAKWNFGQWGHFIQAWSDDGGATWCESPEQWMLPSGHAVLQEPGVIELQDGRVWCYLRTNTGRQWEMFSSDRCATWTVPRPSRFNSPRAPLSMKRNPANGKLLAVWDDPILALKLWGSERQLDAGGNGKGKSWGRTPLVAAVSGDEGASWSEPLIIEQEPDHGYCYTAIHFVADAVLLAYCCGGGETSHVLQDLRIRRIAWSDLGR